MKSGFLTIFIFFTAYSIKAIANDSCKYENLESKFGPVRDQDETGWCYAFAGADLISAAIDLKPPNTVSAFDVALAYYSLDLKKANENISKLNLPQEIAIAFKRAMERIATDNEKEFKGIPLEQREGGYFSQAIGNYSLRGGICLESKFPSEDSGTKNYITKKIQSLGLEKSSEFSMSPCQGEQNSKIKEIESLEKDVFEIVAKFVDLKANIACEPRIPLEKPLISKTLRPQKVSFPRLRLHFIPKTSFTLRL